MKRKLLTVFVTSGILFLNGLVYAGESEHKYRRETINQTYNTIIADDQKNEYGFIVDAPNLVRLFSDNWHLGTGVSKDMYNTNMSEGWFGYAKVTYSGTLLNLGK